METRNVDVLDYRDGEMDIAMIQAQFLSWYALYLEKASFWLSYEVEIVHWITVIGIGYLIFLLIVFPLWRWAKKKKNWLEKSLVSQIDEMIFLLAKYQYVHTDVKRFGGSPHIALMRSIFKDGNYDYIKSSEVILENMHKVEQLLSQKVISEEREEGFLKDLKKFRRMKLGELIMRVIVGIGTLGVGLLFA